MQTKKNSETAIFGAGCFWGVEQAFRKVDGVFDVKVGFSGGEVEDPSYEQVCSGSTGHAEVVKIEFNPQEVSFEKLLGVFWSIHDPTQLNQQGVDVGSQYRSVIFYCSDKQKEQAREAKKIKGESGEYKKPIMTSVEKAGEFYFAEEDHQRYIEKRESKRFSC